VILGITGGIASGKSTAAALLAQHGAHVISADQVAREVVKPGSELLARLVQMFGSEVLAADKSLARKRLGELVFADPQARKRLEAVMHPAIAELSSQQLRSAAEKYALVVYEAPLLFEAGAHKRVDKVLCVTVEPSVQLERVQQRDGCTLAQAQAQVEAQMPQHKKAELSDYVIDNSADLAALKVKIDQFFQVQLASDLHAAPAENK